MLEKVSLQLYCLFLERVTWCWLNNYSVHFQLHSSLIVDIMLVRCLYLEACMTETRTRKNHSTSQQRLPFVSRLQAQHFLVFSPISRPHGLVTEEVATVCLICSFVFLSAVVSVDATRDEWRSSVPGHPGRGREETVQVGHFMCIWDFVKFCLKVLQCVTWSISVVQQGLLSFKTLHCSTIV